jgi:KDO2-lipid IV(A) lauroyltransferase
VLLWLRFIATVNYNYYYSMYYLLYVPLYLLSLLPWRVLYLISDFAYLLLYHVIGYRKDVVFSNLQIAFPGKSQQEKVTIAKEFYKGLCDTFIETLKFLSLSDKGFGKRLSGNFELLDELYKTGQSVHVHSGHFFNWEYINWGIPRNSPYTLLTVYMPITNKAFDKLMMKMRSRYKTVLLSAFTFKTTFHQYKNSLYAMGLAADQAAFPATGYWVPFFGKLTPFVTGPEKSARLNNAAVVFSHFYKVKRGYYQVDFSLVTTTPRDTGRGELTKQFVSWLEDCVHKKPHNFLWSHRRWKWEYNEQFKKNLL